MNKVFQLVWNHFSRTWVAAGETAKRNTKGRYAVTGILAAFAALGIGNPSAKPKSKNSQSFGLSCLTVALAMAQGGMVYAATPAPTALPTGAQIAAGQANIVQTDNTLTVQQQTDKLITNWQSFDIGSQATVNFQQPSSDSVALNRITNQDPTQILGNLNANGQIFLLNPAGIIIGNEAQVNVNTLVATTLNMTDQDFLDENYALTGDPNSISKIVNQGTITTPEGGRVALIAPVVENQGTISTPDGTTALAAASEVQLDLSGNGSLGIRIDKGTLNALVENEQLIQAQNGQVVLTARGLEEVTKAVVNNDGIIEATSLTSKGGRIVLEGDDINLSSTSEIDASGETGGGEVLIGGDWQGTGDMHQAETVIMDAGASVKADAITQGDGGKVVLWSDITNTDSLTEVHGDITARGGEQGGDGGQIETSGHDLNVNDITVNTMAANGSTGEWLLDPVHMGIKDGADDGVVSGNVNNGTIEANLSTSAVTLYGSSVSVEANITSTSTNRLTIKSDGYIVFNSAYTFSTKGDIILWSNAANKTNTEWNAEIWTRGSDIYTHGGRIVLAGGSDDNNDGIPDGYAYRSYDTSGLGLGNGTVLDSGGGDIILRGQRYKVSGDVYGVHLQGATINSGAGTITIDGISSTLQGVYADTAATTITSTNTTANAISITGTSTSDLGIEFTSAAPLNAYASSGNGGITLTAGSNSSIALNSALTFAGDLTINAKDIDITGNVTSSATTDKTLTFAATRHIYLGPSATLTTSSTGAINTLFHADSDDSADGINIISGSINNTNGGWVIFGNNVTHSDGYLVGGDVYFMNASAAQTISTSGGAITIYGESMIGNSHGLTLNSGNGAIKLYGSLNSANTYEFVDKTANAGSGSWAEARTEAKKWYRWRLGYR